MSTWAFRLLLFYICVLFTQPQNRFLFLYPLHIGDICILGSMLLHTLSAAQEGRPIIRFGPATITALLLMAISYLSLYTGAFQDNARWNSHIDILYKNMLLAILIDAMAFSMKRVWAIQITLFLGTLWWIKGGLRLVFAGATYSQERIMGPAVGMVENPNGFAYMLCVMLPVYYYFFRRSSKTVERTVLLALMLSIIYIVFQTGSRTGLVTLVAVSAYIIYKSGKANMKGIALISLGVLIVFPTVGGLNVERFKTIPASIKSFLSGETKEVTQLTQDEQSAYERRMKNSDTWRVIKAFPLGVGMKPNDELLGEQWPFATGQVHNEILMAGKQMGFIGMILYISIIAIILKKGNLADRSYRHSERGLCDLGWMFKAQGIAIIVGGAFSPIPWNAVTAIIVGGASALGAAVLSSSAREPYTPTHPRAMPTTASAS